VGKNSSGGEKWSHCGCTLKVESAGSADGATQGYEESREQWCLPWFQEMKARWALMGGEPAGRAGSPKLPQIPLSDESGPERV
jgi:hypothetical protein